MKQVKLGEWVDRWRYQFDSYMSRGAVALIGGLAIASFSFILLMSLLVSGVGITPEDGKRLSLPEALWDVLMRALDAGTVGGDMGWAFRLTMLLVTFVGIFVVSTLIGLLSNGINTKLENLRKGRSRVIETDHIVILGWSLQVFTLISELALANANRPKTCLVILSEEDKVFMEDSLAETLKSWPRTRLVCRTGSPSNMADLGLVSIQTARSIIVLNSPSAPNDAQVIKTLLAITNIPRTVAQPYHIVVQVQDAKNLDIVHLIGQDSVEVLRSNDLISRIVVQTCRQSGLSTVYMDLLDFSGNEIYFHSEPALQSKTYGQALLAYNQSAVIGIQQADGTLQLNPSPEMRLEPGMQLIVISEDDDTIHLSGLSEPPIQKELIQPQPLKAPQPEQTLILGSSDRLGYIIQQLDHYVAPQSQVTVVCEFPEAALSPTDLGLQHQTLTYIQGDPTDRQVLERLNLGQFDHVLVLCNPALDPEQADAQTLVTLLYLREFANRHHYTFQVVTEILDVRNQALAQVARPDDFVISEQIVSRMLAQVAEQKSLNAVFAELFSPEGAEIYLRPVRDYVRLGQPINFYTLVEAAQQRGESAIGYRLQSDASNRAKDYGIVLNPPKDRAIAFSAEDVVIVLAEN